MTRRLVDADALMHQLISFPFYPSSYDVPPSTLFREYNDYLVTALHNSVVSDEEYIIVRVERADQDK